MTRWLYRWPLLTALLPVAVIWEIAGRRGISPLFPSLTEIGKMWWLLVQRGGLVQQVGTSLLSLLVGFALAIVLGVTVGALTGHYRVLDELIGPYLNTLMSSPMAAFVPVLTLVFGLGDGTIIACVFMYSFFVIAVNVRAGVANVDPMLLEMARSMGASDLLTFRRILLPSALPLTLAGIRLGTSRAVKGMVIGEMLISLVGLGGMLMFYGGAFRPDAVYAIVITLVAIALTMVGLVRWLERRVLSWLR